MQPEDAANGRKEGSRKCGTHVVALVSVVPSSRREHYVGIDDVAAGRTAGSLMGRFLGMRPGKVGVIGGSQSLRDHAERILGFLQVMSFQYPNFKVLSPVGGRDQDDMSEALMARLLAEHSDLAGVYNFGAGAPGVARTIALAGREASVVFFGHELADFSRRGLVRGVMDAIIAQDPAARRARRSGFC